MISWRNSNKLNRKNKTLMNCKALLIGFCIFLTAGERLQAADNSSALMHPDRLKGLAEIKGKIQTIDKSSHKIILEDSSNQTVTVIATPDTVVSDSGDHAFPWTSQRVGSDV